MEGVNHVLEGSTRKQRATKAMVQQFLHWALEHNVYEQYTPGRIRQMYMQETGVEFSECCIRRQRGKWSLVDGKLRRNDA